MELSPKAAWEQSVVIAKSHAELMALYDAGTHLREAAILANAGFAKALSLALEDGQATEAAEVMKVAEIGLDQAFNNWKNVKNLVDV